jgi:hypothetical protein
MASLTETWGSHGGYAGEPAVEETQSKVAGFFASQAGQLALAKGIRASNAPRAMGFPLQKSATFKAGDRVRHVPSGKRGKFVAMANATHGHVMHDDGSASLFAVDELEKDEIGGYSGIPALDDQGRRNLAGTSLHPAVSYEGPGNKVRVVRSGNTESWTLR